MSAVAALAVACAAPPPRPAPPAVADKRCGGEPVFAAGSERATLWIRNSSEYRAASEAIYRSALAALASGLSDASWTAEPSQVGALSALPPAVVMDIDETVLDNSEPQARLLLDGACFDDFPAAWDEWIAERRAPAVPGAAEFIRTARAMRDSSGRAVRVFFITNRECAPRAGQSSACPQKADTIANLEALGLGAPALPDELMVKGERPAWDGEKLPRRQEVARGYRIVLNIGDDLADFIPGVRRASVAERDRARCAHDAYWGRRWFLIPNPIYGSWLVALGPGLEAALAAAPEVKQDCEAPPGVAPM